MGIGTRVKKALGVLFRGDEGIANIISWLESNQGGKTFYKELRSVKDAISRSPYVRRAYDIYLATVSSIPLKLYDDKGEELENTLFHKVLVTPNVFQTWTQFNADTVKWFISTGRYGIGFEPDTSGKPVLLFHLDASKLRPKVSRDPLNPISGYEFNGKPIPISELIYDYWSTPKSGFMGESPMESALNEVATSVAIARVVRNLAENNQRPGVIIAPKDRITDKDMKSIRQEYNRGSAVDQAGKAFIMPLDATLLKAVISPHESQMAQMNEAIVKAIHVGTGIPRILIEAGEATFENQKEVYKNLYRLTIIPMLTRIQTTYTKGIAQKYDPRWQLKFDLSNVWALQPDYKAMSDAVPNLLKILSKDETRAVLPGNHEPLVVGGEEIMGAAMEMAVGQAPPVKGKQKAQAKKSVTRTIWDDALNVLNRADEPELMVTESGRKDAGGFTGQQREICFISRKLEYDGYVRVFSGELAKLQRKQKSRILEALVNVDNELVGLDKVEGWIDWNKEVRGFEDMAHPKLLGMFADAGSKIADDFQVTPVHRKRITGYVEKFAKVVNETTRKQLAEAASKAESGESVKSILTALDRRQEINDDIEEPEGKKAVLVAAVVGVYLIAEHSRARLAAEYETHNVQGYGLVSGGEQIGAEKKHWNSAFLPTSRQGHMAADGQEVGLHERFIVDGESLEYPGDSFGSAANTANCQCFLGISKPEGV